MLPTERGSLVAIASLSEENATRQAVMFLLEYATPAILSHAPPALFSHPLADTNSLARQLHERKKQVSIRTFASPESIAKEIQEHNGLVLINGIDRFTGDDREKIERLLQEVKDSGRLAVGVGSLHGETPTKNPLERLLYIADALVTPSTQCSELLCPENAAHAIDERYLCHHHWWARRGENAPSYLANQRGRIVSIHGVAMYGNKSTELKGRLSAFEERKFPHLRVKWAEDTSGGDSSVELHDGTSISGFVTVSTAKNIDDLIDQQRREGIPVRGVIVDEGQLITGAREQFYRLAGQGYMIVFTLLTKMFNNLPFIPSEEYDPLLGIADERVFCRATCGQCNRAPATVTQRFIMNEEGRRERPAPYNDIPVRIKRELKETPYEPSCEQCLKVPGKPETLFFNKNFGTFTWPFKA